MNISRDFGFITKLTKSSAFISTADCRVFCEICLWVVCVGVSFRSYTPLENVQLHPLNLCQPLPLGNILIHISKKSQQSAVLGENKSSRSWTTQLYDSKGTSLFMSNVGIYYSRSIRYTLFYKISQKSGFLSLNPLTYPCDHTLPFLLNPPSRKFFWSKIFEPSNHYPYHLPPWHE